MKKIFTLMTLLFSINSYSTQIVRITNATTSIPIAQADLSKCEKNKSIRLFPENWPKTSKLEYTCFYRKNKIYFKLSFNNEELGSFYTDKDNKLLVNFINHKLKVSVNLIELNSTN